MKTGKIIVFVLSLALVAGVVNGQKKEGGGTMKTPPAPAGVMKAVCVLSPTEGNTVTGTVTFSNNGPSTAAGVGTTFTITPGLGTVSFPT